jgi:DNA polymerase III alpha subunit/nucleotidyltransferase/DNA polymerase involved in DNA repair
VRTIVHLDADAFFASVEQASDPRLRGLPVAVGGEKRGIIASASYEARKFGVFTPMPTVRARKLCPKLIVLPGDFDKYEHFSRWMFSYAQDFTPDVEIASIDEGYFDLSAVPKPPRQVAQTIRDAIRQALKITVSEGLASNKLVSAIASKLSKPAAFREVPAGGEIPFLHPLPNSWLPGVGPQTAQRLDAAGLALIAQIAATPTDLLHLLVGSLAPALKAHADGIDERPVQALSAPAKSYSQQQTFAADLTDEDYAEAVLRRMADELMARVRADGKTIRTLTVKVRYNDMAEDQRSDSLFEPTDLETDLYGRIQVLLRQAWKRRVSLRLVSLKLANVYDGRFRAELALERSAVQHEARRRLAGVVDELRRACGAGVLLRGHDFRLRAGPADTATQLTEQGTARVRPAAVRRVAPRRPMPVTCVPLAMHSAYSFLDSTLSIAALVALAREHELPALALADTGNLHGAVEFTQAAQQAGIKPILGTTLNLAGQPVRLYVQNAAGYQNLCRLLSRVGNPRRGWSADIPVRLGSVRPGKADQHVRAPSQNEDRWSQTAEDADVGSVMEGSVAARQRAPLHAAFFHQEAAALDGLLAVSADTRLAPLFGDRFYLAVTGPETAQAAAGARCVPLLPVHYARRADRWRWNILQAIRTGTLLQQTHPEKQLAGDFHLRTPTEMAELFRDYPAVLANLGELAERCSFVLPIGALQFPDFHPPDGSSPRAFLRQLVLAGAQQRYGAAGSAAHRPQLEEELTIIAEVGYEAYFLVVWDLLQECRRRGIEWITRGSAADSLVCYCLGISDVCPIRFDLYFRRFLNRERMAMKKLPDIDVDFAHDRKDDVVDLIFAKYGAAHAAVVGGFSTFQARSAFAEIAKVLGVAERETRKFTDHFPWRFGGGWVPDEPTPSGGAGLIEMLRASPENRDLPLEEEPYRTALLMAEFLDGMPRYPKMHPCGVVLSGQPMVELTPTFTSHQGRPTTHFDMDAVEAIGLVKIDILAQGGLAAMRDARQSLARRGLEVDLGALGPWQDAKVWELIASGGARAVHHIESPAMIGLCRQCNVRDIDGLIAIVSVIRPGAANEGKKQSFARRYQGLEPVTYPHPSLTACLRSTFGLVVYEEHILQMCEAFAGLPPGRADVLRRALAKQKRSLIEEIRREFFAAAQARGHDNAKTTEVWSLVSGFAGYAFCKAHSTAYGVEAYQAAWLKRYHPAEFMAAVLTNGKGFYHPLVYVLECHRLGLRLLPPSVNDPGPAFEVVELSPA